MHGWRLVMFLLMAVPVFTVQAQSVFDDAAWLRDPRVTGKKVITYNHRDKVKPPAYKGPQNIHTLLRKEITLKAAPKQVIAYITGDDYYKFFCNGTFVVQGPESGYPFAHPYYWLDITQFLQAGKNSLAAHCYYQGLRNRVFNSADNRSGFILKLAVTYADGEQETYLTDTTWKCYALQAHPGKETVGYSTQFVENIDMRKQILGWKTVGFDDSQWKTPVNERQDHQFVLQLTPPLQVYRQDPVIAKKVDEGRYFYDFGHNLVGHSRIVIQGKAGHTITVRHGEELLEPEAVRYEMRANCKYEEFPVLSGGKDVIEFYDYRTFRYMEILDAPSEPEVWVDVRHHPFVWETATLKATDPLLGQIWDICKRGVQMGSQGGYLDCPSREKGQYLGDAVITARSHLWLTADPSLTKKSLDDFYQSRTIEPGIMAVAPSSFMQEIADYSLQYPFMMEFYLQHSGDKEYIARIAPEVFDGIFGYFETFRDESGLISGMPEKEKWILVDWPKNLRDDYDYDYAKDKAYTSLNAFYYGSLKSAARLARIVGMPDAAYEAEAERVAKAMYAQMVDPETGLFVDAPGSKHSALHANALPLFFGMTEGADRDALVKLIEEKGLSCGVYMASYVIESLFKNGEADLAYSLITSKDEHSWHEMLKAGATTCMEAWGPEQKWNTSWCHPWSSSPIYLLTEYVLGITPAAPGWQSVRISPQPIKDLPELTLTVPTPLGPIEAHYTPGEGYRYNVPHGAQVTVDAPEGVKVMVEERLTADAQALLDQQGWQERVGNGLGVWVDVDTQQLCLIEQGAVSWQIPCATAKAGTGQIENSLQTPLGWHHVDRKFGDGEAWGRVFRSRMATNQRWQPGDEVDEDLVLTRILWLAGDEPGVNQGKDAEGRVVDSRQRHIYIHGTNGEAQIGTPSSHGCIRLLNDDVLKAFDRIPEKTPVLITQRG